MGLSRGFEPLGVLALICCVWPLVLCMIVASLSYRAGQGKAILPFEVKWRQRNSGKRGQGTTPAPVATMSRQAGQDSGWLRSKRP